MANGLVHILVVKKCDFFFLVLILMLYNLTGLVTRYLHHIEYFCYNTVVVCVPLYMNNKHGYMVHVRYEGQITAKFRFIRNKCNGKYKRWFKNGRLAETGRMKNDLDFGTIKTWFNNKNHQISSIYTVYNKDYEGRFVIWYSNGQIETSCNYVGGLLEGDYDNYDENGKLISRKIYVNGIELR